MSNVLKTRRRYQLMGNDFSSQEVRVFSANCKDPAMIKVFEEGRDLYSEVASMVYHMPYDECKEFRSDGTFNLDGKKRRTKCKSIILGIQYGRGISSIAEQIKSHDGPVTKEDKEEARELLDKFFKSYPLAKVWMDKMHSDAHNIGYVEDLWGRRRRLPDASLPKYTFESIKKDESKFNPLLGSPEVNVDVGKEVIDKYTTLLDKAFGIDKRKKIIEDAEKQDGIKITNNSGFIAQAERQALNAPIQGGSATITKLAIRDMCNNERLKELDFHLLVPVHDEVIGESPLWNSEECCKLMGDIMCDAGKPECVVSMKTDGDCWDRWYIDVAGAHIKEEYENAINNGSSPDVALQEVYEENCEFELSEIKEILGLQ